MGGNNFSASIFIPLALFMLLCMNIAFFFAEPTPTQMQLVKESVKLAKDQNIPLINDWSYGYWIDYYDYNSQYKGSFPNPDYNSIQKPFIALSDRNLTHLDCIIEKQSGIITKVWSCK